MASEHTGRMRERAKRQNIEKRCDSRNPVSLFLNPYTIA
jgi:hypothetical protein